MPTANLPLSRLINVGVVFTQQAVQSPSLNTGLVLGTSTVIDTATRMRTYNSLPAIGADFGTTSQEYLAAVPWFGQNPQPLSLNVGRWCNAAAAGQLICGPLSAANQLLSVWTGIANGSFKLAVDGGALTNVPAMNFGAAGSLGAVATIMQTAVRGLGGSYANVSVTYDPVYTRFLITSGTTGPSSAVAFLQAGTTGTDISGQMNGLVTSSGAYVAPGVAAETALAAVVLFDNRFGGQWYNLFVPSAVSSDSVAISPYIDGAATPHFYAVNTQDANCLNSSDTTNIMYLLQQLQSQHTAVQYSSTSLYAVWSMIARIATVNWAGNTTAISLMYKAEPGIVAEALNSTQAAAIDGFNGNVYTNYQAGSGVGIIEQGICPSGQFIDTVMGADGLRLQIQTNLFNLLTGTATKIPQTDAGITTLQTGIDAACSQYVSNGFLAPGIWNGNSFGQLQNGQWLDKGYYIYAAPLASQSQAQRSARIAPPFQVAAKTAGAVDTVNATVYVNN